MLTLGTLLVDAVYLYGVKFRHVIHSDAAATVLMASRALHAHAPVFGDWYYGNGEVWFFAPHIAALVPVALLGVSPLALQVASILGFTAEIAAVTWAYRRAGGDRLTALFGASLMLMAWSRLHVLFVYVELSYGFASSIYAVIYTLPGALLLWPDSGKPRARARLAALGFFLIFAVSIQSPARGLVFTASPIVLGCLWPWRGVSLRARGQVAGGALAAYGLAVLGYELVIRRVVTFSIPSGHNAFHLKDLAGIKENVETLGRGIAFLAGEQGQVNLLVVPPILFMLGAIALVVRHVFASRELTVKRFACVAVLAQLSAAVLPLVVGNLVVNPWSVRYLMPSLLVCFGLAAIIAVEALSESRAWRRIALAWLVLAPLTAVFSLLRIVGSYSLQNDSGQWANRGAHQELANELRARGLTHGFSTYWNANLVTLLSNGETLDCSVYFDSDLRPYKWNTRTTCFDRPALPTRFYVASAPDEAEARTRATAKLPPPIERFNAGNYFDVAVYETARAPLDWLDVPIPDGEDLRMPMRMKAAFPQLRRVKGEAAGDRVTASGEEGCVVFGPYIDVPKGNYVVRWIGSVSEPKGAVGFDVTVKDLVTGKPDVVIERSAEANLLPQTSGGELVRLELSFDRPVHELEARVFSRGGAKVTLEELVLERR